MKTVRKYSDLLNRTICAVDRLPLWWAGLFLLGIVMLSVIRLGEGCVFTIHDQLDESMMNYVLTARHMGENVIPEMLGGINASGLAPSAVLFVPLFALLPPFYAFLLMYATVFAAAFIGMYLLVKELTDSSIMAAVLGGCFAMLPLYPVYGLSQAGIPLVTYAFYCLYKGKYKWRSLCLILFFALTSHLVYTGYAVIGFAALACAGTALAGRRRRSAQSEGRQQSRACGGRQQAQVRCGGLLAGLSLLTLAYVITNYRLFAEILLGQGSYVSHREEMVNSAMPFARTMWSVFTTSAQHAFTYQEKLVLPIFVLLIIGGFFVKKYTGGDVTGDDFSEGDVACGDVSGNAGRSDIGRHNARKRYLMAVCGFVLLFLIAVFYGICKSEPIVRWKNNMTGFLHYFQAERVYWLYPAGWYLELALAFSFWKRDKAPENIAEDCESPEKIMAVCKSEATNVTVAYRLGRLVSSPIVRCILFAAVLYPTADTILHNSYFYMNVNQYNNGSGITGYISWESYYAEELMAQIEEAIGRDMSTYRVAHLGISPAPALMHGFYTADGYSNNYPLDYKHAFRQVIAAEMDEAPETAVYFDKWGNRCYLFNSQTGTYWMLEKGSGVRYEGLKFDMEALAKLECEYLFCGGEIADAERMGLKPLGYFETENSYWGIWVYELNSAE